MPPESSSSPSRNMGINWNPRGAETAKNRGCEEAHKGERIVLASAAGAARATDKRQADTGDVGGLGGVA